MRLSDKGAQLIANFEGFRSCPYWDVNHWSIGYGTASSKRAKCIDRAEARRRLRQQADETYGAAVNRTGVKLNQNQFDALTSLAYNVGPGVLDADEPVGRALRRHDFKEAADAMLQYNRAGGQVLPGLVARRKVERNLFLTEPPHKKIRWSDAERRRVRTLTNPNASRKAKAEAKEWLRGQVHKIERQAQSRAGGWERYDRGRRRRGIARLLEGKKAEWW